MAVLLITHDMGVIAGRTDRVVVMYAGEKAEEATTTDLFRAMRHPYTQALLASMPNLENTTKHELKSIAGMPPSLTREIVGCRFAPRCVRATDRCRIEHPELSNDNGHHFACFHPTSGPAPVEVYVTPTAGTAATPERRELARVSGLVKEFAIKGGLVRRNVGVIHAVSDVSFSVTEGETFGLVGESGCGKTTIGRMLVGLEPLTSGEIHFDDKLVSAKGQRPSRVDRRDRQMMFQDPYSSLDPRMKVAQILGEPLMIQHQGSRAEQRDRVTELLLSVGLDRLAADRYPHQFSGGQRQRIGFARALALQPRLIVADEPVSALDVSIQAQILNLMKELQRAHHLSYVMISHDLAVVYYMADTIAVMYLGKIVEMGDAESVFRSPAHPYTRGLLDAVPVPDPEEAHRRRGRQVVGELPSSLNPPSGCRFRTRCPRVQSICADEEPPMRDFSATQQAACHFPLKTPVGLPVRS
jgi:oligopeptide/dipeptide ABC transporter ATP-binding protein